MFDYIEKNTVVMLCNSNFMVTFAFKIESIRLM